MQNNCIKKQTKNKLLNLTFKKYESVSASDLDLKSRREWARSNTYRIGYLGYPYWQYLFERKAIQIACQSNYKKICKYVLKIGNCFFWGNSFFIVKIKIKNSHMFISWSLQVSECIPKILRYLQIIFWQKMVRFLACF